MSTPLDNAVLRQLYDSGLNMKQIAERFGVTKQAIHIRFVNAGIPRRDRSLARFKVDVKLLKRLIQKDKLTNAKAAEALGVPVTVIRPLIKKHKIERGYRSRRFPELNSIKVGESILVPRGNTIGQNYIRFYQMGRKLGIKLSANRIDDNTVRVTRIA
jgi:predicted DNA-binding protein YlxM (UPF0122 family)